mmetsp:Transcript_23548/g.41743  ORF Transcript_23548/g.41743 Transcript_23548/m.41743 type:complete len:271 (-) Transcript_23548:28-840(-)
MTQNEQIENLNKQVMEGKQKIEELKQEILDVHTLWKGENEDLQNIYSEADAYKRKLEREADELDITKAKLERAYADLALQRQEIEQERNMLQEAAKNMLDADRIVERPPDYKQLSVAFDSVLTNCARRVMAISRGEDVADLADLRKNLKDAVPKETKDSLKPLKSFVLNFKENHARRLGLLKETVAKQVSLLQQRAASEGAKLVRPLPSPNLSPVLSAKVQSGVGSRLKKLADRLNEKGSARQESSFMLLEEEVERQVQFAHRLPKRDIS